MLLIVVVELNEAGLLVVSRIVVVSDETLLSVLFASMGVEVVGARATAVPVVALPLVGVELSR